ncbi:hypothetical protein EW026_g814 [Hermanssonia centrifuga]|uniref:C2H2-type domain-containing protein n=1 Tax=Hermanssonia centrifuga TaxID=98765 RepID=A0A4S4KUJ6_9APHY|nr:hypothetical protein EW026_g814 [Hermanssonia centrifuga]
MHIHDDHIGVHKSNYTCEWRTCARRGLAQTSRFALISHIRSHTGEKPFVCPLPECDKSFTRSDALAKHTRMQHNIVPPAPGRGGNRKRKREEPEPTVFQGPEGYGTFKLEPPDVHGDYDDRISPPLDLYTNGNGSRRSASPDIDIEDSDPDDGIPPYLMMKAKHQYVLEEHASLIEELRAVRFEERRWREAKDAKLDELLRKLFGQKN